MYKRIITVTLFFLCLIGGIVATEAAPKTYALCQVNGETAPSFGLTYSYTKSNCTETVASWAVSGGTIIDQDELSVSVQWTSTGTGSVSAKNSAGTVIASMTVNVGTLDGGYISTTSQSIVSGNNAGSIIAAAASGGSGSFSYQWQKASSSSGPWTDISGSTDKNCDPGAVTATTYYRRKVTSGGYTAYTTNTAVVNLLPAISIGSVTPSSQYINAGAAGSAISISMPSGGDGSYTYQWQSSTDQSTWNNISGATGSSFAVEGPLVTTQQTSYYRVIVSSAGASVTSGAVSATTYGTIQVSAPVPATQAVNFGITPSFIKCNTIAGGDGTYTYQWQYFDGSNWQNITGVNTNTYTPSAASPTGSEDVLYRLAVSSNGATIYSAQATVTTYGQLSAGTISIGSGYINYNSDAGTIASAAGASGGDGNYAYQWYVSTDNNNWQLITGATSATYSPGSLTTTTYYKRKVSCLGVEVYSNVITVNVYPQLQAGTISGGSTANYNGSTGLLTLSGTTGGNNGYTYQWQYFDGTSWLDISGANAVTYTPTNLTAGINYRVVVSSNGAVANTSGFAITVYPQLQAGNLTPASSAINNGSAAPLISVSSTGGNGSYTYQWESSSDGNSWTSISGATTASYSAGNLTSSFYYRVQVTSNGVSTYSTSAYVQVYPLLNAGVITPATQTINYSSTATVLTASVATGGNGTYSYQWQYLNGSTWTDLTGETNLTYTPGTLSASASYRVVFTSNGISVNSNTAVITVYPELVAGVISPASQSVFYHNVPATLNATAATGGNGIYTYDWEISYDNSSWVNLGASGLSLGMGNTDATTYYRIRVGSNGVTKYTGTATTAVYPVLLAGSFGQDSTALYYNTLPGTLTVSAPTGGNGSYTYQWQSSTNGTTWTVIPGEAGLSYIPPALKVTTYYKLTVISGSVSATSNVLKVKVYPTLNPGSIRVTVTNSYRIINYGGACGAIFNQAVPTGGDGTYTYQWQKSLDQQTWENIPGATTGTSFTGTVENDPLTDTAYYRRVVTSFGVCGSCENLKTANTVHCLT